MTGLSINTEGGLLLLGGLSLPLLIPLGFLTPYSFDVLFIPMFIGWFFWFCMWASKGGIPRDVVQ